MTPERQKLDSISTNNDNNVDGAQINLSGLDATFLELEE